MDLHHENTPDARGTLFAHLENVGSKNLRDEMRAKWLRHCLANGQFVILETGAGGNVTGQEELTFATMQGSRG